MKPATAMKTRRSRSESVAWRIVLVMSEEFLRRLTPSLAPLVTALFDCRIVDIRRPARGLVRLIREIAPDGLIMEWLPIVTEEILELGIPSVIADTDLVYPGATSLDVDDWAVGREAARYLLDAGHKAFAVVGNGSPYGHQRIEGFGAELAKSGFGFSSFEAVNEGGGYMESVRGVDRQLCHWLNRLEKPVAVFAVHDPLGRAVCEGCRAVRLAVPEEVAVVGANDDELVCALSRPALSSVVIPWGQLGAAVGQAMRDRLETGRSGARPILIPPGGVRSRQSADMLASSDPLVARVLRYLSEHHRGPISIGTVCAALKVSRRGVERKFAEVLGRSPRQVLATLRVETARKLLLETAHPVGWVAELAGFGDPERMAVVLRRATGRTASEIRGRKRTGVA